MPDATDILELDARTVERIAAGEVVERPASVVKELVENAIDADASRIDVEVDAGGTAGIRVSDDGVGMTEAGVRQAVEEHTTSKIGDIDDLEAGVGTLGFRGEALHAIGAVSRMTITTCPRDASGEAAQATELRVEGGEVVEVRPAGRPPGTTVAVQDLFYNVPARRKYLKTEATEFGHVNRIAGGYALANPAVALSLEHDGGEVFRTTGGGDRREAVLAVYGREVARNMFTIAADNASEGPLEAVSGLVSHPETNRASRDYCTTLVNGRYVQSGAVRDAIVSAYGNQLAADRYPFAVLDLRIDPATIDVNVHPRKLEIRFADEAAVCEQVRAAVEATLLEEGLVRTRAPRGRSASAETEPRPESGSGAGTPSSNADHSGAAPDGTDASGSGAGGVPPSGEQGETVADPDSTGSTADSDGDTHRRGVPSSDPHARPTTGTDREGLSHQAALGDRPAPTAVTHEFDALPTVRLLGQFRETFLVGETEAGLVLIDQHAADERINFERLRASVTEDVTTQALADPIEVDVTPGEAAVAEAQQEALASLGFRTESVDGTLRVRTVPDLGGGPAEPALVQDVLGEILQDAGDPAETVDAAAEALLADLACYPSITGSTALTDGDAVGLLERLDDCENPWACPHGRPTVVLFETDEIEGRFERDYPGH